jgi:hypothetical protein
MDRQQKRAYAWEGTFRSFCERTTTRREVRRIIKAACRLYRIPPPVVQFRSMAGGAKMRLSSDYDPSVHTITMGFTDCNHAIACHETAHAITDELYENVEDHGPEWLGIYLYLLEWCGVAPRTALRTSAKAAGLKWRNTMPAMARKKAK